MKVFDNGAFFSVRVSRREVAAFNRSWPCSQLPDSSITFVFDNTNGDLVDILPYRIADKVDGPEAGALCDDAKAYGYQQLTKKAR
jgi:hypothetical protein